MNSRSKSPDIRKKKKLVNEVKLNNDLLSNGFSRSSAETVNKRKAVPSTPPKKLQRARSDNSKVHTPVSTPTTNNRKPSTGKSPKKVALKHVSFEIGESNSRDGMGTNQEGEPSLRASGPMTAFEPNFEVERPGSSDSGDTVDSEDEACKFSSHLAFPNDLI